MKYSRLFKIIKRACCHQLRGDHAALIEDQRLLALHLLLGHADRFPLVWDWAHAARFNTFFVTPSSFRWAN